MGLVENRFRPLDQRLRHVDHDIVEVRPRKFDDSLHIFGADKIQRDLDTWKPIDQIRIVHNPSTPLWESGVYEYDGAGNIYAIGEESFSYDLVSRLKTSTVVTRTGAAASTTAGIQSTGPAQTKMPSTTTP